MERCEIVIVGAGPAGLVLGLALARLESIIVEKDSKITDDPRGIILAGDAVRILVALGMERYLSQIGEPLHEVQFHVQSFAQAPFHVLDQGVDLLRQAVPTGIYQSQPLFENALRELIKASEYCELRAGCNVLSIKRNADGMHTVLYEDVNHERTALECGWLIGADGKRGVVRKHFLEPLAGIRQEKQPHTFEYDGVWIAANLEICLPTPRTHPASPIWSTGMSPQEVFDCFWPRGFHFCCPPGKATAAGRFGPHERHLWRHEFEQRDWDPNLMDPTDLLWEHLTPMLARSHDLHGRPFLPGSHKATFPKDCIKVLRCRPYNFSHRVVNKWFSGKCVLIGDSAHVFPPFGGQGIVSGIRDAHQLAWRLAMLLRHNSNDTMTERCLLAWEAERKRSMEQAARFTKRNSLLCNESSYFTILSLSLMSQLQYWVPWLRYYWSSQHDREERMGFQSTRGGFLIEGDRHAGHKLPQIYVTECSHDDSASTTCTLSDAMIFRPADSVFRILCLVESLADPNASLDSVFEAVAATKVHDSILNSKSIMALSVSSRQALNGGKHPVSCSRSIRTFYPSPIDQVPLSQRTRIGYDTNVFSEMFGKEVRFVVVRPDFYIYATAHDILELQAALKTLRAHVLGHDGDASR